MEWQPCLGSQLDAMLSLTQDCLPAGPHTSDTGWAGAAPSTWWRFHLSLFFIGGLLVYNVVCVSAVQGVNWPCLYIYTSPP